MSEYEVPDGLTEAIDDVMMATVLVTTIAYLRADCKECILAAVREKFVDDDFMVTHGQLLLNETVEDYEQFMRQLVIFTKDFSEELCKLPCSKDDAQAVLGILISDKEH